MGLKQKAARLATLSAIIGGLEAKAQITFYDNFSSGILDSSKWEEVSVSNPNNFTDEHYVDSEEGNYHTRTFNAGEGGTILILKDKLFVPGESLSYEVNYLSGSGNRTHGIDINGGFWSLFGFWNSERDAGVGNDLGNYNVSISFLQEGVSAKITKPDSTIVDWPSIFGDGPIGGPASQYSFGVATRTGHDGTIHMDYDNFTISSAVPEPSTYGVVLGLGLLGFAVGRRLTDKRK